MTIWIDDGTDDGFLANCGNCVFAVEDPTEGFLTCGWDPPVATGEMTLEATASWPAMTVTVWRQPQVHPDQHCHHHPSVQQAKDFGRGWPKGLRRPEDRARGGQA